MRRALCVLLGVLLWCVAGVAAAQSERITDFDVRVVILTGAGPRGFCVGADLKERKDMTPMQVRKRIDDYGRCFEAIDSLPKPVICAINGFAFGGGLELALACDLRLMSTQAKVGLTELKLGIIPGAGGTQRLPRLIGAARAKQMIFTGERLDAARALEMGVINEACAPEALMGPDDLARAFLS